MAAGVALAGLCSMVGATGAAARAIPAPHRGTAGRAGPRQRASGFANWSMFRGDPAHTGVSPETGISTTTASTLTPYWSASVASMSYSSPAVVNLKATGVPTVFVGGLGIFAAYPASGGAPLWTFPVNKMVNASPAVLNGVVYFASTDGTMYAVNAKNGALLCSYATNQFSEGSPLVVEDPDGSGPLIYEGTAPTPGPGFEWAIYGPGNTHGSCTKDWAFDGWTIYHTGTWSPPAYGTNANGVPVVVFGSDDPDNSVYALNAETGAMLWTYRTNNSTADDDVGASPTISAPGVNGFADGVVYVTGKDKITYAFDLTTGALIWKDALVRGTKGDVSGAALVGDTVYLGSDSGVHALNANTGAQVWHALPKQAFYASSAVVGPPGHQVLITASITGHIYALDLATGKTLWTLTADSAGIWSSPAVSQNCIYITGKDGQLLAFTLSGAKR